MRYTLTRLSIIAAALVTLNACATTGDPTVRIETVTVIEEVEKPCPAERPARPAPIGDLPTDLIALAAALGAKLAEYSDPGKYADRAEAIMDRCTVPPSD